MTYVDVATKVSRRFALDRLHISPDLVGTVHQFVFEGKAVTVRLPSLESEKVPVDRRIALVRWQTKGNVPLEYQVNSLDLKVDIEESIQIPAAMLQLSPNQSALLQPEQSKRLDELVSSTGELAGRAFDYWLRTLRWKSKVGYIGEPRVQYPGHNGGDAVLKEQISGNRLWLEPVRILGQMSTVVSLTEWNATQQALSENNAAPIWFDYLFDSQMRINNNDLIGGILSLAIALEVNVRNIFSHDLRRLAVQPVLLEIFDQTNLRALLNRIKRLQHWDDHWRDAVDLDSFNKVMNYRDRVMHSADTENLDAKELRKLGVAVTKFAYFTSDFLGLS
jgi:hypothetical protein